MNVPSGLIDRSATLITKAALMAQYMRQVKSLDPIEEAAYLHYRSSVEREPITRLVSDARRKASEALAAGAIATSTPVAQQIEDLKIASVREKRKVLESIPIVTVPLGAAYLGIHEAALHRFKYTCRGLFGARYLGRQCYSIAELNLIAKNLEWMMNGYATPNPLNETDLPKQRVLDHVTFVDLDTASAFTNLTYNELSRLVRTRRNTRNYRLADLEQIRSDKALEVHAVPALNLMLNRPQLSVLEAM